MTLGYLEIDESCPECAARGIKELLYSNGTRSLCTSPWCSFEYTQELSPAELPPGSQPMLL